MILLYQTWRKTQQKLKTIFMLTIPVIFTLQRTYRYQSYTPSESQSPLSYWIPSSVTVFSHWTLHISVHFRPAFKQQQLSTVHALLHEQESSSRTSSGAGLDPSHTNFTTFEILSTSQPCPPLRGGDYQKGNSGSFTDCCWVIYSCYVKS